jgi:hypothetical protein
MGCHIGNIAIPASRSRDGAPHKTSRRAMRNALAHGALEVHTPEMSLTVLLGCAEVINQLYAR